MKKIFTLLAFFAILSSFAQGEVGKKIGELRNAGTTFRPFSVLDQKTVVPSNAVDRTVKNATFASIKRDVVANIANSKFDYIEVSIPYNGRTIVTQLYKADIYAVGFHTDTDKQKNVPFEQGAHYRGIVKDDPTSVVALNFFKNEMNGIISASDVNNLVIAKMDVPNNIDDYIVYSDADLKIANQFDCGVKDSAVEHDSTEDTGRAPQSVKCVTMYFELDYSLYLQNGSSVTTTNNWMSSVFNNVQTLYANDGISVSLRSTYIWTTQDPYSGSASSDYLYQFNEMRPVFDGDVGQLIGIDPGGLGGVAVSINGLCSQNNFSYSDVNFAYNTVPTYSWTIMVITHEMGHLLGSPHTHACTWNGNSTAIDNCAPAAIGNTAEGYSCLTNPPTLPATNVKGTIMSYCHLIGSIGINLANGFGPQPLGRVTTAVNNGGCLSTDCVNTCINTVANISAINVEGSTATITWVEMGAGTSWQIQVMPFASNFGNWVDVSTPSYNVTGLLPNKYYKVRIRPVCAAGLNSVFRQYIFATGDDWCSGVTISDTGGPTANYGNVQDYVRVLIPTLPNKKIKLNITQLDLENNYDYLYIYDGDNTSATDLSAGGFTGNNAPGIFTSTAADGALTLRFFSDPLEVGAGYLAEVSCENSLGVNGFSSMIDFTYYPNPTDGIVNISSKTSITSLKVYNVAGQLLMTKEINALDTKVNISAFASGTYFFKVKFNEQESNFKILKK